MSSYLPIILIIAIAVIAIPIWLKKRKNKNVVSSISTRKNKDEVWKAVKQYLKDSGDYGKEIIDCYVAKRNSIDYINPNMPRYLKNNKREEIKIRKWQFANKQKLAQQQGKKIQPPKEHDLYVVCFTTKLGKTGVVDRPRAIECEVMNTRINKKEYDRKILINGLLDYDKEMEWIAPIKFAETIKNAKTIKHQEKQERIKQAKLIKQKNKVKIKVERAKLKAAKKQGK